MEDDQQNVMADSLCLSVGRKYTKEQIDFILLAQKDNSLCVMEELVTNHIYFPSR